MGLQHKLSVKAKQHNTQRYYNRYVSHSVRSGLFFLRERKYFIIFALLFVSQFAQAQTPTPSICNPVQAYFQKHDGTGTLPFDTDKTTKLNNAAIKLVQTIPDAQCANFKVYDYAFTPISQYTKGGYAEDFEYMKLDARGVNRDQYYLLFAKEVDAYNHVTKIWVDVELPKTGKFSCLSDMQRSLVKIRLEKAVEDNYYENQSVCFAESRGIAFLQQQVKTIVDCCANGGRGDDCIEECPTAAERKTILESNNATSVVVNISECEVSLDTIKDRYQFSKILVDNGSEKIDLLQDIKDFIQEKNNSGFSVEAFITSSKNTCININTGAKFRSSNSDDFSWVNERFNKKRKSYSMWYHLEEEGVNQYRLYLMLNKNFSLNIGNEFETGIYIINPSNIGVDKIKYVIGMSPNINQPFVDSTIEVLNLLFQNQDVAIVKEKDNIVKYYKPDKKHTFTQSLRLKNGNILLDIYNSKNFLVQIEKGPYQIQFGRPRFHTTPYTAVVSEDPVTHLIYETVFAPKAIIHWTPRSGIYVTK